MSSSLIDITTGRVLETISFDGDLSRTDIVRYQHSQASFDHETKLIKAANLDEYDRIRAELINWIESLPNPAIIHRDYFLTQLDRICAQADIVQP